MNIYINSLIVNDTNVLKIVQSLRTLYKKRPDLFKDGTFNLEQPFHVNKSIHPDYNGLGQHFTFKNNGYTHHAYVDKKLKIIRLSTLYVVTI